MPLSFACKKESPLDKELINPKEILNNSFLYLTNFIEGLTSLALRFIVRIQKAFTWQNFVTFKSLQLNSKYRTYIKAK